MHFAVDGQPGSSRPKVVVVGAGFGGLGAAHALAKVRVDFCPPRQPLRAVYGSTSSIVQIQLTLLELMCCRTTLAPLQAGVEVTVLDAASNPGGLSGGFRTERGRSVEAGIKGFWYQYRNIDALVRELGIPNPFTPWTRSSFWSPAGLQVCAVYSLT